MSNISHLFLQTEIIRTMFWFFSMLYVVSLHQVFSTSWNSKWPIFWDVTRLEVSTECPKCLIRAIVIVVMLLIYNQNRRFYLNEDSISGIIHLGGSKSPGSCCKDSQEMSSIPTNPKFGTCNIGLGWDGLNEWWKENWKITPKERSVSPLQLAGRLSP